LASLGRFVLSGSRTQNRCLFGSFRDDIIVSADASLLSQINSLGSDASANQQPLPPYDMVVRCPLLARKTIGMEGTRIRKGRRASASQVSQAMICFRGWEQFSMKVLINFPPVAFLVVFVDFSGFFVLGLLVRSVAKRLVNRETTLADPDRLFLRLNLERSLVGFQDFAHNLKVNIESKEDVEPEVPESGSNLS
jgi:hypothetical protein